MTHQRGGDCCASQEFAERLATQLAESGVDLTPSDSGVYTDVYEYRGIIPECVNLSVGYYSQHSKREELDYSFASALLNSALSVDWNALPACRTPECAPARIVTMPWKPIPVHTVSLKELLGRLTHLKRKRD